MTKVTAKMIRDHINSKIENHWVINEMMEILGNNEGKVLNKRVIDQLKAHFDKYDKREKDDHRDYIVSYDKDWFKYGSERVGRLLVHESLSKPLPDDSGVWTYDKKDYALYLKSDDSSLPRINCEAIRNEETNRCWFEATEKRNTARRNLTGSDFARLADRFNAFKKARDEMLSEFDYDTGAFQVDEHSLKALCLKRAKRNSGRV